MQGFFILSGLIQLVIVIGSTHAVECIQTETVLARYQSVNPLVSEIILIVVLCILLWICCAERSTFPTGSQVIIFETRIDDKVIRYVNPCHFFIGLAIYRYQTTC